MKFYRKLDGAVFGGVLSGISAEYNIDLLLLRIVTLLLFFISYKNQLLTLGNSFLIVLIFSLFFIALSSLEVAISISLIVSGVLRFERLGFRKVFMS